MKTFSYPEECSPSRYANQFIQGLPSHAVKINTVQFFNIEDKRRLNHH